MYPYVQKMFINTVVGKTCNEASLTEWKLVNPMSRQDLVPPMSPSCTSLYEMCDILITFFLNYPLV